MNKNDFEQLLNQYILSNNKEELKKKIIDIINNDKKNQYLYLKEIKNKCLLKYFEGEIK